MEKLKLHTPDLTAENIKKLAALFPNCITETRDDQGNLSKAVDFDQLRQELSTSIVDGPRERYHLDWPGKREALLAANAPVAKTLRPCREESVDFDATKNLFIEGDNLDALKLLQEIYLNKVKMIYIDPPYNTGKDLLYKDDFRDDVTSYFRRSNQVDDIGNRLVANTEANGRFHSDWLTFIYPRIKLSRALLSDDGLLFISINDVELGNLIELCNEIYGHANHFATFVWVNEGNIDNQSRVKLNHEYVVVYAKDKAYVAPPPVIDPNISNESKLFRETIENTIVKNGPKNPVSDIILPAGFPADFDEGVVQPKDSFWPRLSETVRVSSSKTQNQVTVSSGWSSKELAERFISQGFEPVVDTKGQETVFVLSETGAIYCRKKRLDAQSHVLSVLKGMGTVQGASASLAELGIAFSYPKPTELIEYLLKVGSSGGDTVMDFFAGSGTFGESVLNLNRNTQNGSSRRYIIVQIPQACDRESKPHKAGFKTVADLCKGRLRAYAVARRQEVNYSGEVDVGFRVLKIDASNMKDVYYTPDALQQPDLLAHLDNIREDRTPEDLLFQVLVDWGIDLALPIATEKIAGKTVFFVDGDALAACFDASISEDLVKELAKRKPLRAVFRDSSYDSDSVKINVEQIFKLLSPATEIKSL
jgi:adenine-specific DNA-methyltransferase